jgi:hypothetical protein
MKKLPLELEALRVESFATGGAQTPAGVPANLLTTGLHCVETNFISCARPSACTLC